MHHKFTGQELDGETGLYFYNARYYDPALGRFISADSIIPDPSDPQAFNRYSYVRNNPIRYTDPSGHDIFGDVADTFGKAWDDTRNELSRPQVQQEIIVAAAVIAGGYYAMPYLTSATWGTITPGAVGWGAATGGAIGGYSASVQGGNVLQGVVFGAAIGAGAGALCSALPGIGAIGANGQIGSSKGVSP